MTRKALWRRFEEASKQERYKMVDWIWHGILDTEYGPIHFRGKRGMSRKKTIEDFLEVINTLIVDLPKEKISVRHDYAHLALEILERTGDESLITEVPRWEAIRDMLLNEDTKIKWRKVIVHDKRWMRLRNSFHGSNEWKSFRNRWLTENPVCARCGKSGGIFQVHHKPPYNLDSTVLEEGFLEGLKHSERFETLCRDCHKGKHADTIEYEKSFKGDS